MSAFYFISAALFVLGGVLMRGTSYFDRCGGDVYHQKRTRRLIGEMVLIAAALSLGIAVLS